MAALHRQWSQHTHIMHQYNITRNTGWACFFQSAGGVHLVGWKHFLSRLIPLLESADTTSWAGCTDILPDCINNFWGFLPFPSHYFPILLPLSSHSPPIILPSSSQHPPNILPTSSQQPPNNLPTFLLNHPEGIPKESRRMWWKGKRYGLAVWHTMVGSSKGYGCTVSGG